MASTNQSPFYQRAEQNYLEAKNPEDKLKYLEEMIKECPKHKSSEKMLSNLKNRYRKLKESFEKQKKSGKGSRQGIKKSDMQAVLVGFPNSGKTSLFNALSEQDNLIASHPFSTNDNVLGTIDYENAKIQLIDTPSFPRTDLSLINTTDTLLLVVDSINQIADVGEFLKKSSAKKIVIFAKTDLFPDLELRKIESSLRTKKLDFFLFSSLKKENLNELKKKIFETFPIIRVYTKEPRRDATKIPMILKKDSTVKDVAEKILKGFSKKIKRTKIWGPSSKFSGQIVGLEHILKDKDIVEFQTA